MNFLAHIHLSGNNPKMKLGNFIADSIKGASFKKYCSEMQKGILMHRDIDSYTDSHPVTKEINNIIRTSAGRFSGIYTDIFYDHFLSVNWQSYNAMPLALYISKTYEEFSVYKKLCPPRTQQILPSLVYNNWLGQYISFYGLKKVLTKMSKRTIMPNCAEETLCTLKKNYRIIEPLAQTFLEEVSAHTQVYRD